MTATDYDSFANAYSAENKSGLLIPDGCEGRSFLCFLLFVLEAV
jgi:hypothetical protein